MVFAERFTTALVVSMGALAGTAACRRSAESAPASEPSRPAISVANEAPRSLQELGRVLTPGHPGASDVLFEIDVQRDAHAISPYVYGINSDGKGLGAHNYPVIRWGGNRSTAYNWETNASNAGSDYLYQNDSFLSQSEAPAQPLLFAIDNAMAVNAATIVTLSNADYVAADKLGNGDVRQSGPAYLTTRFKRNYPKKPTPFAAVPDTKDDGVYQDELVAYLKTQRPHARLLFSMDNEPDLWSHTHAEIFPKGVTYADLWRRNRDFAKAAKDVMPNAEVLGFVSYGYMGYKSLQNASDANGRDFIEWYLDQAATSEKVYGVRLIDYLDLHWYPEAQADGERIAGEDVRPSVVEAREQAPRSLWDQGYEEASWIRNDVGGPIDLLHRVQAKINAHYPGTKIAISEWNFGAGKHISGGIATADVLGIFGRQGVGLATYWTLHADESFAFAAFDAYRNFDGQGSKFGDTSISATSSDLNLGSVYASIDRYDPARTVVVAINKAVTPKRAGIMIHHAAVYSSAKVFVLSGGRAAIVPGSPLVATASNAFLYTMPAQSISVIVPQP